MLILEGPNKVGKSTLAKELGKPLYIRGIEDPDKLWFSSVAALELAKPSIVLDRCWISECVYKARPRFRLDQMVYLALLMERRYGYLVVLLPPTLRMLVSRGAKMTDRPEGSDFTLEEVCYRYKLLRDRKLWAKTTDGYRVRVDQFLPRHTEFVCKPFKEGFLDYSRQKATQRSKYKWKGAGSLEPTVLLLADRVNLKRDALPLVPVDPSCCGAYMMRVIWEAKLDLTRVHVHNAFTPGGEHYPGLVDLLQPKVLIALGDNAHDASWRLYKRRGTKVGKLPHPQWMRRFGAHEEKYWGGELHDTVKVLGRPAKLFRR